MRRRATAGSGWHGAPGSWRSSPPWPEGCARRGECVRRRRLRPSSQHSPAGGARPSPVPRGPAALSAPAPSAQQLRAQGTRRPHSPSRDTPGTDPRERVAGGTRLPRTLLQQVGAQGDAVRGPQRGVVGPAAWSPGLEGGGAQCSAPQRRWRLRVGAGSTHLRFRAPTRRPSVKRGRGEKVSGPFPGKKDTGRCVNAS